MGSPQLAHSHESSPQDPYAETAQRISQVLDEVVHDTSEQSGVILADSTKQELQRLSKEISEQYLQSLRSVETSLINYLNRMTYQGYEMRLDKPYVAVFILINSGFDFAQHFDHNPLAYVHSLEQGLKEKGQDSEKFATTVFSGPDRKALSKNGEEQLAETFFDCSASLPQAEKEEVILKALELLASDVFDVATARISPYDPNYGVTGKFEPTYSKKEAEKELNFLRSEFAQLANDRKRDRAPLKERLDKLLVSVQLHALNEEATLVNNSRITSSRQENISSTLDAEALAEIFVRAGARTVRECGGDDIQFQLLLPQLVGFDQSQIEQCYLSMFGTKNPNFDTPAVSPEKIVSSIISIARDALGTKDPSDLNPKKLLSQFVLKEILNGAIAASSQLGKYFVAAASTIDDLGYFGLAVVKNYVEFFQKASVLDLERAFQYRDEMLNHDTLSAIKTIRMNPVIWQISFRVAQTREFLEAFSEGRKLFRHNLVLMMKEDHQANRSLALTESEFSRRIDKLEKELLANTKDARYVFRMSGYDFPDENNAHSPRGPTRFHIPNGGKEPISGPSQDIRPTGK